MSCDCIAKVNARMADKNTRVEQVILLFPTLHDSNALVRTGKVDSGKRGKPTTLMATYCPFCGVKYEEASAEAPATEGAEA